MAESESILQKIAENWAGVAITAQELKSLLDAAYRLAEKDVLSEIRLH